MSSAEPDSLVTIRITVGGMYPSLFEFEPGSPGVKFERSLESGCAWRIPTELDRELIGQWFEAFREFHSGEHVHRGKWERTLLATVEPVSSDDSTMRDWGGRITSLVIASTLHTRHAQLRHQALHFRVEDGREVPRSGSERYETIRLANWPAPYAEELGRRVVDGIVHLYPFVRRLTGRSPSHRLTRAVMAYRVAISHIRFSDPLPILLCASLEALTGSTKQAEVIDLVRSYAESPEAPDGLKRLYACRQWFAHGIDIEEMRDPELRRTSLDEGLVIVKEVFRNALQDDVLFELADAPARDVRAYLAKR